MGTVSGVNTRRYHGLLIATLNPPSDRYSIFPRVEETAVIDGRQVSLAAVQYPGTVSPSGYELLETFSALPFPTWRYRSDKVVVTKSLRLIDAEQSVLLTYSCNVSCRLSVRLFISFRDYHSLMRQNSALNVGVTEQAGLLTMKPYDQFPALSFYHEAAAFEVSGEWFHNHEYLRELERGLDFREDLYSPGILHFDVEPDGVVHLCATLENHAPDLGTAAPAPANQLTRALDQFRVLRADKQPTLIAGYPWFTDWSRDTLISLPAFIACGFDAAEIRSILEFLLAERKQGLLPNRFSDRQSTPEYNTVDGTLWLFIAAFHYMAATANIAFLERTLFPAALDIIDWHMRGTFYGIHVDPADHLLSAGEAGTQLTWMDAKIGDYVVTPRMGKPVEINALWHNALQITSKWATLLSKTTTAEWLLNEAALVKQSFEGFWNSERNCLYDVLTPSGADGSLRPNQLFAISLPHALIDRSRAQAIIQAVQRNLLTPTGIRTLEPGDANYRPRFEGDMKSRDSAYHQGTVWPWLIGPYVDAYLHAFGETPEAFAECTRIVKAMLTLLEDCCLGSVAEVHDGDAPHRAAGCPAQLWSVAQIALAAKRLGL